MRFPVQPRRWHSTFALLAALPACGVGPQPRDVSNAPAIPIRNTAAVIQNDRAVTEITDSPDALAALAAPDRSAADRALDASYESADVLTYLHVTPGMRVAEIGAGTGYLTELLARSVGASGAVYAENPPSFLSHPGVAAQWAARLTRPENARVARDDRALSAPLPPAARGLDLVYLRYFYRDLRARGVDRRKLLANVLDAMHPGGRLVVLDRVPPQEGQAADPRALHVQESRNARDEIERAGFHFVNEGRFLRDSAAAEDWDGAAAGAPTPQDRFFLTFMK